MRTHGWPIRLVRGGVAAIALLTLLSGCLSPQQQTGLALLNADRAADGRPPVEASGFLQAKAQAWADHLAHDGTLAHSDLAAGLPSCWTGAGENVGFGGSIADVERAYMQSAPHHRNIVDPAYTQGAVGVATAGGRTFTVEEFMSGC